MVECADSGWCGAVVGWDKGADGLAVVLADRRGRRRAFPLQPAGFRLDGTLVTLTRPVVPATRATARTASGSRAVQGQRARVARGSRIWVEGKHDAQLVEKIWGDDLRVEGVVVEELGGADLLAAAVRDFAPGPDRRLGVLLDHIVPGSKESRIAAEARRVAPTQVLILGHPYIDVWQAVRPAVAGIERWPSIPPAFEWKDGVCTALGWGADTGVAWQRLLARVHTYADLEPSLLGRVEELVDFVTATEANGNAGR